MKTLEVTAGESVIGGMAFSIILHFLIKHISPQSYLVFARNIEYIAVDSVLVDAFGKQLADNEENLRA